MADVLDQHSYGKQHVRLTKVVRHGDRHELMELSVDIHLEGDFAASYTDGDNSKIIATDSMKNTVYVLAKENEWASIEAFAVILASHFKKTYPQVKTASVSIRQTLWQRMAGHAFVGGSSERRTCRAVRGDRAELIGGISGLEVLKTSGSEFADFVTDRYRTLADAHDRIFATAVEADWAYGTETDYNHAYAAVRAAMLKTFADHHSLAVQQTLLAMGRAALAACEAIDSIRLVMPNQHRIPFNLEPFGLKNGNDIFVPVDEPYGLISGLVKRE